VSLHRILTIVMIAVLALATAMSVSLLTLASYLHRATSTLESSVRMVRLAEDMEVDLLTYARSRDAINRASIASELMSEFRDARRHVQPGSNAAALLSTAQEKVAAYLDLRGTSPATDDAQLEAAFSALERLVDGVVDQSERALEQASGWNTVADEIGFGATVGLLLATAALLVWLRYFAFRSVLDLRNAIQKFATGMPEVRAPESGPEELRSIARQFNLMADALTRQRENQLSFLAGVAHDLRNPLGALKMSAAAVKPMERADPAQLSRLMRVISRQVDLIDRIVGDLLDATRIEAGQFELRFGEYDARQLAHDVFDLFQSSSSAHHLTLRLPDVPVEIRCDALRIEQVLNNLVSNAIKYSPLGGMVQISLTEEPGAAVFQVSDEGMGIARDDLPHIFEPFRRVKVSKEAIPGVGLGLSVARRIVQAHNGEIDAYSEPGKGSTFSVRLRRAA